MLALTAFPHSPLPNTLLRELGALARHADLPLPLTEEVAADIFMGTFTAKWRDAAEIASQAMAGTLYANYNHLPHESLWAPAPSPAAPGSRGVAADFAALCNVRAAEAGTSGGYVARNGAILEQAQILTTHNLAVLAERLDLADQVRRQAPALASGTLRWVVRRLGQRTRSRHPALIQVKSAAYAWRQAIFLLSYCEPAVQASLVQQLRQEVSGAWFGARFSPAVDGLARIIGGERFTAAGIVPAGGGRRFLGWAVGQHWYFAQSDQTIGTAQRRISPPMNQSTDAISANPVLPANSPPANDE
jgi:hypothetical protein